MTAAKIENPQAGLFPLAGRSTRVGGAQYASVRRLGAELLDAMNERGLAGLHACDALAVLRRLRADGANTVEKTDAVPVFALVLSLVTAGLAARFSHDAAAGPITVFHTAP